MFRHRLIYLFALFAILPVLLWALLTPLVSSAPNTGRSVTYTDTGQALGNAITRGLAQADFDGDGDLDFYAANNSTDLLWLNDGNGNFTDSGQSLTGSPSFQANAGDVDGDNDLDIAVGHIGGVTLWLNDGNGTFTNSGQSIGTGVAGVYSDPLLADLDGDTDLDLFLGTNAANEVWLNISGVFTHTNQFIGEFPTNDVAAADMDGDGDLDIITANGDQFQPAAANFVWLNDGDGNFSFGTTFSQVVNYRVALLDVDGDSDIDVYAPSFDAISDTVWLNNGSVQLTQSTQMLSPGNNTSAVAADMNGDGATDIILGRDSIPGNGNEVWLNQTGVLSGTGQSMGTQRTWDVGTGDLNGDGTRDLVFANFGANEVWLADSDGPTPTHTATATSTPTSTPEPPTPEPVDALDWRRDVAASAGDVGNNPDMALDGQGRPHFTHVERQSLVVEYDYFDGVRWYRETISPTAYSEADTRLALDQQGRPHVIYHDSFTDFRYVTRNGTQWQSVATLSGQTLADLIVDQNDRPVVAYENDGSRLAVARWGGAGWLIDEIDTQFLDDVSAALARGAGSTLYLAYVADSPTNEIRLATFNGSGWSVETAVAVTGFAAPSEVDLALDGQNRPVVVYTVDDSVDSVHLAVRLSGGWSDTQIYAAASTLSYPSLAYDSQDQGHVLFRQGGRPLYDDENGGWDFTTLPGDESLRNLTPLALDNSDRAHFGFQDSSYRNLNYHFYAPAWERFVLEISDAARLPAVTQVQSGAGVSYYSLDDQTLRFLERAPGGWAGTPVDLLTLPGVDSSVRMALDGRHHVSYRDSENDRLMFARFDGTAWQREVVDESGDVGYQNTLLVYSTARFIVYWDRDNERLKVAKNDSSGWRVFANDAGIPLASDSGYPRAVIHNGVIFSTYYDAGGDNLRLAEFDIATQTWSDTLLAGGPANEIRRYHDMTLSSDSVLHLIFHDATADAIIMATRRLPNTAWSSEPVVTDVSNTWDMSIKARTYAGSDGVRIVYGDVSRNALIGASRIDDQWHYETIRDGDQFLVETSLSLGERPYLSYAALASNMLEFAVRVPYELQRGVLYNPYDPGNDGDPDNFLANVCAALLDPDVDARPSLLRGVVPTIENDYDVFDEMTRVFSTSPGGQHYIDLYGQHVAEMVSVGAQDPRLMWDSYQVLQDFMPGVEALVTGRGSTVTVTQRMADNALDIWQRLAAAGSPQLASTINGEVAASNNLQDFVGMSFDEWALELGVVPPVDRIYLPLVENEGSSNASAATEESPVAWLPDGLWQRGGEVAAHTWPWALSLIGIVLPAFGWWRRRRQ